jgi:hypothetical protein
MSKACARVAVDAGPFVLMKNRMRSAVDCTLELSKLILV